MHLPLARFPHGMAMSRDGSLLFVASDGVGQIVSGWQTGSPKISELQPSNENHWPAPAPSTFCGRATAKDVMCTSSRTPEIKMPLPPAEKKGRQRAKEKNKPTTRRRPNKLSSIGPDGDTS
jgi:hypothetical protein